MSEPLKIIMVGECSVGKTSLVNAFLSDEYGKETQPTIGVNHQKCEMVVNNKKVPFYLWDTAGQEEFHSLVKVYARSASGAILVASIIDDSTLDKVSLWLDILKDSCEKMPPVILAVNKIDLMPSYAEKQDIIFEKYKDTFAAILFCSAKTRENVDQLFRAIAREAFLFNDLEKTNPTLQKRKLSNENGGCKC